MRNRFGVGFISVIAGLILLLIDSACSPLSTPPPIAQPTETPYEANLKAEDSGIKVFKGGAVESVVQKDQTVNVQVNDRIEVDKASRGGYLEFPDLLEVEVFRFAIVTLADVKQESGGSTFVSLNQVQGHVGVYLNDKSTVRVTLETIYATITSLQPGTQFLVCQAEGKLTCLKVLKGAVEVVGQGVKQTIKAGEATYILKDQPPKPAICAPDDMFIAWQNDMRKSADTPAVAELVAALPQVSCADATAQTPRLPASEGMVKIPYGTYEVGASAADDFHIASIEVPLDNYWIDKYEVTNAQYKQYLDKTGSPSPAVWPGKDDSPVRGVSWDQAAAYCTWANKRLPNEAEWEVAGRGAGPDARLYPWGNDPEAGGEVLNLPVDEPYAVGAFSFNVSPFGVYDMVGNVWEWVGDPYASVAGGLKILRGGQFGLIRDLAYRQPANPNDERFLPYAGFRCAANQVMDK
jgi:formylglycine-generating enzyme required for sulfatase activity